jgi:glycosyltransferase involved in cell wall biosynthesis
MERLRDIFELLDSIKVQTYPNIETLLVVERSKELLNKVNSYTAKKNIPNLKVLFNDGEPGASAARNLGIAQTKGDIIAFIDDDAVAYPDWAEKMIETYKDDSVVGVTGPAFPLWQDKPISWFPEEFYWVFSCSAWAEWNELTEVRNVWTMNASSRRNTFVKGGLFSTSIGPRSGSMAGRKTDISEDVELSLRVRKATGKRIVYNPAVKVKHRVDTNRLKLEYVVRWSYWVGYSKQKIKRFYSDNRNNVLSQEHKLLKRIITRLFPSLVTGFFRHPISSWRRLLITVSVLFCVATGYLAAFFTPEKKRVMHNLKGEF